MVNQNKMPRQASALPRHFLWISGKKIRFFGVYRPSFSSLCVLFDSQSIEHFVHGTRQSLCIGVDIAVCTATFISDIKANRPNQMSHLQAKSRFPECLCNKQSLLFSYIHNRRDPLRSRPPSNPPARRTPMW